MSVSEPIKSTPIDPPTMAITISVNDSPLAGQEGSKVTSRMIRERLFAESETNVAIKVKESDGKDSFEVGGRGELQLGVLIENMRREGFELSIGRPRVLIKEENGKMNYMFATQTDGETTCKSPMGMFDEEMIPNDLHYVKECIQKYENE